MRALVSVWSVKLYRIIDIDHAFHVHKWNNIITITKEQINERKIKTQSHPIQHHPRVPLLLLQIFSIQCLQ